MHAFTDFLIHWVLTPALRAIVSTVSLRTHQACRCHSSGNVGTFRLGVWPPWGLANLMANDGLQSLSMAM